MSQGNHLALTLVDTTKKVYYMVVISITAEQLGPEEARNGGRQAKESSENGGSDRL